MAWSFAALLFRTLKRNFVSDQTLEPTTIAGFAQFFDDFDRTDAWTAAVGADVRVADSFWMGAEYLYRSLEIPVSDTDSEPYRWRGAFRDRLCKRHRRDPISL